MYSPEHAQADPYAFCSLSRASPVREEFAEQLDLAMRALVADEALAEQARWRARGAMKSAAVLGVLALIFVSLLATWGL
jgi:hypothetical protein